jgi:hypothetical protein
MQYIEKNNFLDSRFSFSCIDVSDKSLYCRCDIVDGVTKFSLD